MNERVAEEWPLVERRTHARQVFAHCRCGKEHPAVIRFSSEREAELLTELHENSLCRACAMEIAQAMNLCPEWVTMDDGISTCRRSWHHGGRCEPQPPIPPEVLAQAHEKAKVEKAKKVA